MGEEAFGVTLTFSEVPERLTIPFAAITAFADPSVQFGLQFDSTRGKAEAVEAAPAKPARTKIVEAAAHRKLTAEMPERTRGAEPKRTAGLRLAAREQPEPEPKPDSDPDSNKVIPLDIFRKK